MGRWTSSLRQTAVKRLPDGKIKINANPLDVQSIEQAAADLTRRARRAAVEAGKHARQPRASPKAASQTLAARELVAGLTERSYVKQRGLIYRDSYTRMSPDHDRESLAARLPG